jgi:outer membrane protein assembly factor BamB
MVFVASIDEHRVAALEAGSGKPRWSFTAGGRVAIPPTYYKGLCLFGSADGWVYCLRAADGQLVWRYRAAPSPRRIVVRGQLESPWPVDGGVLIVDGVACFAAGRHGSLDDGMHLYAADPFTGSILWSRQFAESPVLHLLVGSGESVSVGDKISFSVRAGEKGGALPAPPAAYLPTVIDPAYVLGAKSANERVHVAAEVSALVKSGQTVFATGWSSSAAPEIKRGRVGQAIVDLPNQNADPQTCELWSFSAADGNRLYRLNIGRAAVFDGLAAAGGRLYLSTQDGKLICFGPSR